MSRVLFFLDIGIVIGIVSGGIIAAVDLFSNGVVSGDLSWVE